MTGRHLRVRHLLWPVWVALCAIAALTLGAALAHPSLERADDAERAAAAVAAASANSPGPDPLTVTDAAAAAVQAARTAGLGDVTSDADPATGEIQVNGAGTAEAAAAFAAAVVDQGWAVVSRLRVTGGAVTATIVFLPVAEVPSL